MSGDFGAGNGVDGTSPLNNRELSQIMHRPIAGRYGNIYRYTDGPEKACAMASRYADALPPVKASELNTTVLHYYKKLKGKMKLDDIIISSITCFFLQQGYTIPDVAAFLGRKNPKIVELSAIEIQTVGEQGATVDGEDRVLSAKTVGKYSYMKVRVYSTDHNHTLKIKGEFAPTFSSRRLAITSPSTAMIIVNSETSYRLFRLYEQFRVLADTGGMATEERANLMLNKYSFDSLTHTVQLSKALGLYQKFRMEYMTQFRRLYAMNNGRTAAQIARDAIAAAQEAVMKKLTPDERVQVLSTMDMLGVDSFYIKRELERW